MLQMLNDLHDCVGKHDGYLHRKRCVQSSKLLQASPRPAYAFASLQARSDSAAHLHLSTLHATSTGFCRSKIYGGSSSVLHTEGLRDEERQAASLYTATSAILTDQAEAVYETSPIQCNCTFIPNVGASAACLDMDCTKMTAGVTANMQLRGCASLRPIPAAHTLHGRNAMLPGLSSLRAAKLMKSSTPPQGGVIMSASRNTVAAEHQVQQRSEGAE